MKRIEKLFISKLNKTYDGVIIPYCTLSIENKDIVYRIGCEFKKLGGKDYFKFGLSVTHWNVETSWFSYKEILGYTPDIPYTTYISFNYFDLDFVDEYFGLDWEQAVKVKSEEKIIDEIIDDYINPTLIHFSSLIEIDKRINETDDVRKCQGVTEQFGLPYRKVLVAREVSNPRIKEIEENMRDNCELSYKYGLENNDQIAMARKFVFEELFGKRL